MLHHIINRNRMVHLIVNKKHYKNVGKDGEAHKPEVSDYYKGLDTMPQSLKNYYGSKYVSVRGTSYSK